MREFWKIQIAHLKFKRRFLTQYMMRQRYLREKMLGYSFRTPLTVHSLKIQLQSNNMFKTLSMNDIKNSLY